MATEERTGAAAGLAGAINRLTDHSYVLVRILLELERRALVREARQLLVSSILLLAAVAVAVVGLSFVCGGLAGIIDKATGTPGVGWVIVGAVLLVSGSLFAAVLLAAHRRSSGGRHK